MAADDKAERDALSQALRTQKELDERYHDWLTALARKNETN